MTEVDHGAALLEEIDGALFLCETAEQNAEEQAGLRRHAEALIAERDKWRCRAVNAECAGVDLSADLLSTRAERDAAVRLADKADGYLAEIEILRGHITPLAKERDAALKAGDWARSEATEAKGALVVAEGRLRAAIARAEKAEEQRDRARALIQEALRVGKLHASEYAWEALVEGCNAALADDPPADAPRKEGS